MCRLCAVVKLTQMMNVQKGIKTFKLDDTSRGQPYPHVGTNSPEGTYTLQCFQTYPEKARVDVPHPTLL